MTSLLSKQASAMNGILKVRKIFVFNNENIDTARLHESLTFFHPMIDLFSLYVLFSHFTPRDATLGNSLMHVQVYA